MAEVEQKLASYVAALQEAQDKLLAESQARVEAQQQARAEASARVEAERRVEAYAEAIARTRDDARSGAGLIETLEAAATTGNCECCLEENVPKEQLVKIDSGQLLCLDCVRQLRQCATGVNRL
jgi:hypothetical protein